MKFLRKNPQKEAETGWSEYGTDTSSIYVYKHLLNKFEQLVKVKY